MPHRVTAEAYRGDSAYDDTYEPAVPQIHCFQDDARQLVRNANGEELVSMTTLYTARAQRGRFVPDSRVTLADGRVAYVILARERSDGNLGAWQHLEVNLR